MNNDNVLCQILAGVWLNLTGGCFRLISTWSSVPVGGRYPIVFIGNSIFLFFYFDDDRPLHRLGQAICGYAQTFTVFIPPKFAFAWFPEHQRTLANSLCFASKIEKMKTSPVMIHF